MKDRRPEVGAAGEEAAVALLRRHGLRVVARNVEVGRGEIDILARHGDERVAVEVRSVTGRGDPLSAFGAAKAQQVRRLARRVGASRVDLVAVKLGEEAAELRWVRGAG